MRVPLLDLSEQYRFLAEPIRQRIDKVLVSRTLSTLDVLVVGLVGIAIFETILGILRTYVFALSAYSGSIFCGNQFSVCDTLSAALIV